MIADSYQRLFSRKVLDTIFPADRADRFFEALLGDAAEGAYDIRLIYVGASPNHIEFEFRLDQRPGKCLACHLTFGLPEVFARHPIIDVAGVVRQIDALMPDGNRCSDWRIGRTREVSQQRHVLPLAIDLASGASKVADD